MIYKTSACQPAIGGSCFLLDIYHTPVYGSVCMYTCRMDVAVCTECYTLTVHHHDCMDCTFSLSGPTSSGMQRSILKHREWRATLECDIGMGHAG